MARAATHLTSEDLKFVGFKLPIRTVADLDRIAQSDDRTRAYVLRRAVTDWLEHIDLPAGRGISPPCPAGAPDTIEETQCP